MIFKEKRPNIWEYFDAARKLNQRAYVDKAGFGATANLFVRRRLFDKYGLFQSDLESGGDYEFGRRLTTAGEKLVYADRAIVRHPARKSFKAVLNKSKRVAKGQKQLEDMGLLEHGTLSRQSLRPVRRFPKMDGVLLNAKQRLAVVVLANFFKYSNLLRRL
jgi:GT2 family glycosyltransferase